MKPGLSIEPRVAAEHFRLCVAVTAERIVDRAASLIGSHESLLEQFPFVAQYLDAAETFAEIPLDGKDVDWESLLARWQAVRSAHLPLAALARAARLDFTAMSLFVAIGLIEEDGRFGALFEAAQGPSNAQRPTVALLQALFQNEEDPGSVSRALKRLLALGLVVAANPEAPRSQWVLHVPAVVWDAARGDGADEPAPYLRHRGREGSEAAEELVLDAEVEALREQLPALIASGSIETVIVRGPAHNGRRSLLRRLGWKLGRSTLELGLTGKPEQDQERVRTTAALAVLLHAMPVFVADPPPGEIVELPELPVRDGPLGIVALRGGSLRGPALERSVAVDLEVPSAASRARLLATRVSAPESLVEELALRFRMTSGSLHRVAALAETQREIEGRVHVVAQDLRRAAATLGRAALETLATRLHDAGSWNHFAGPAETLKELRILEERCRYREKLGGFVGDAFSRGLNCGVRALFQGPSGTGKTLAARLLASSLGKDLYRVDLAAVVNKYIGETRNLARIFAVAEELDVALLLDEGDALLARRTGVSSANDRYANLETNFLLQRLETFEGVAIVTTNAPELIDGAFQRRMDAVVDFRSPEAAERWQIWQLHLPGRHDVPDALLREVALRCQLTGGQIRNAALHAALLALSDGGAVRDERVEGAVHREYKKAGGVCPLRPAAARIAGRS